jgi:hypothetical protein
VLVIVFDFTFIRLVVNAFAPVKVIRGWGAVQSSTLYYAVEWQVMSKEQTFRTRTVRSASEKAAAVSALSPYKADEGGEPATKKDFEAERSGVFAAPGSAPRALNNGYVKRILPG